MSDPDEQMPRRWHLTIPGSVLEVIGRVTVLFAHLEGEIDQFIWSLIAGFDVVAASADADAARRSLEGQRIGQAVTAGLLFRPKVRMLLSLATQRCASNPERIGAFEELAKGLELVAEKRNRLVHAMWMGHTAGSFGLGAGSGVAISDRFVRGEGMRQAVSIHTQEELSDLADPIAQLGYAVSRLHRTVFAAAREWSARAAAQRGVAADKARRLFGLRGLCS